MKTGLDAEKSNLPPSEWRSVEDHHEIREGLGFLIDTTEGYRLAGSFSSMEEALRRLGDHPPDAVLLDIGLPGMSGIEGARILKERWPEIALVALTVYDDDDRVFEMLCAEASGYLLKKTPPCNTESASPCRSLCK